MNSIEKKAGYPYLATCQHCDWQVESATRRIAGDWGKYHVTQEPDHIPEVKETP